MAGIRKDLILNVLNSSLKKSRFQTNGKYNVTIESFDNYFAKITTIFGKMLLKKIDCSVEVSKLPLSLKKWTVLSSPFAHKTARTQFEKRKYRYKLTFDGLESAGVNKFRWYLQYQAPPFVKIY